MTESASALRVMVTRPIDQADGLLTALAEAGYEAMPLPMLETYPSVDSATEQQLAEFCAIEAANTPVRVATARPSLAVFISSNAVRYTAELLATGGLSWPSTVPCVAIGGATAAAIVDQQWPLLGDTLLTQNDSAFSHQSAMLDESSASTTERLLQQPWAQQIADRSVYIFRGVGGRELLAQTLSQRGAEVSYIETYARRAPRYQTETLHEKFDAFFLKPSTNADTLSAVNCAMIFASLQTFDNFDAYFARYRDQLSPADRSAVAACAIVAPSPRIADAIGRRGFHNIVVAQNASAQAFVEALRTLHNSAHH